MPGIVRSIPNEDHLYWFKRLNRQYLTPLALASRDLVHKLCSKMHARRQRWPAHGTHYVYTTERFAYSMDTESSDCEEPPSEPPPEPISKLSPFAATAVPRPRNVYTNSFGPWEQSFTPGPQGRERRESYSFPIAPRSPSPQPLDPPPTNHIRTWNRYSGRLELFLPTPEPQPESPSLIPMLTERAHPEASPASNRRAGTSTCTSRKLPRLPSIESGFGPSFGLNQFRGEWLRVSQFGPGRNRSPTPSDFLESIPEDQLINLQTAVDNLAPVSAHRTRSSMASSVWSPRRSVRYSFYHQ